MSQLRAVTYNVFKHTPAPQVEADIHRLMADFDVITVQEFNTVGTVIIRRLPDTWGAVRLPTMKGTAILYRRAALTLDAGSARIVKDAKGGNMLKRLPGRRTILGDYHSLWANFTMTDTGAPVTIASVHTPAHSTIGGRLRAFADAGLRGKMYAEDVAHVAATAKTYADQGRFVFVGGDWNTDYRADRRDKDPNLPVARFTLAGLRSAYQSQLPKGGTFARSLYDGIFGNLAADSTWVGQGFASDHHPAGATYTVPDYY